MYYSHEILSQWVVFSIPGRHLCSYLRVPSPIPRQLPPVLSSCLHFPSQLLLRSFSVTSNGLSYHPDVDIIQCEEGIESPYGSPGHAPPLHSSGEGPRLRISTSKVCTQILELPEGVLVSSATVAAGHLSSSTIYPACFAPYLLSTACTDGRVHFWHCRLHGNEDQELSLRKYEWAEWEMMIRSDDSSSIKVAGKYPTPSHLFCGSSLIVLLSLHQVNPCR